MSQTSDSPAVKLARAHVEAWSNKDFDTARNGLAADIAVTTSSTNPEIPATELVGVEAYMGGLVLFARPIVPGSVRVTDSVGDDRYALLMVSVRVDGPPYGKLTIHNARLYRFDDNDKIAAEQVIFYTVPD
jgi:SnoaL-like domain